MAQEPTVQELRRARQCVEVLRAVQKDTRTSGWYRGEVRGQEAIGTATVTLLEKGLIQTATGPQPFRLTASGKEFIATQIKDWEKFLPTLERPEVLAKVAKALGRVSGENAKGSKRKEKKA